VIRLGRKPKAVPPPPLPPEIEAIRASALKGHLLEQVLWGKVLLNSIHVPPDHARAVEWFTIAANAHYGPAHNMLGRCSHFGWGRPQDLAEAARCYARAAELGDDWGRYNLAILRMRGLGMARDMAGALALFRQGALAGHAKSMNLYGRFLEEGWETPADPAQALLWYQRSAEGGDYRGQHNHACALREAGQVEVALGWWERAVETATPDILGAMIRELAAVPGARAQAISNAAHKRRAEAG